MPTPGVAHEPSDAPDTTTVNRSFVTRISTLAAERWIVTLGAWFAVVALGLLAYVGGLAREGFPAISLPIAVVEGTYFVDDPEAVDADVTVPLGETFSAGDGVDGIQAFSQANTLFFVVQFDSDVTSVEGVARLDAAIAATDLPAEAQVSARPIDATKFLEIYDVLVAVTGPADGSIADLEAQAAAVADHLAGDPRIDTAEVRNLITEAVDPATGDTATRQTRFSRVALEGEGFTDGVVIGLIRNEAAGLDTLGFTDAVDQRLDSAPIDDAYAATVTAEFASEIRNQIGSLTSNLLTGLVAVAIVSFLLIGWRTAVVTVGFMTTVMLAALAALWFLGYSLNTITLFALILTLGLLVDDAIVISESLDASRDDRVAPIEVVRTAINRVGSASMSGTLTTVLVFAPLLFVTGILGAFIRAIPATVMVTLLLSFLFSVVFIPAVARPFLLRGNTTHNAFIRSQQTLARWFGKLAEYPSSHGAKGVAVGAALVVGSLGIVASSFSIAGAIGFNVFPPAEDADAILIDLSFDPGTSLEAASALAAEVDAATVEVLGEDLRRAQYVTGNERGSLIFVDLVSFRDRDTKAPTYVDRLEEAVADLQGVRVSVSVQANAPPTEDYPFAVQIDVEDGDIAEGQAFAAELRDELVGLELDKATGDATEITDALISTEGQVFRIDGRRTIEVRGAFSTDDLTANVNAAEELVVERFDDERLAAYGLDSDDLAFDFGQESSNQEDFASLAAGGVIALALMVLLLVIQFRSLVQPPLILLAIPFSFFGMFGMLALTGNTLSFFVVVGFIALTGVVVNNTILLIDAANQNRRDGMRPGAAIGDAVTRRFRPLVATTLTTVVGLVPLARSDPFWEAFGYTLIGGLLSSTVLVIVAFPVFYLAVEKVRTPIRNAARRRLGRTEI